ncbi:MAG: helix-hairpin-helix domain-containing protein, partial [Candidatus Hodgkinia cicadicola]
AVATDIIEMRDKLKYKDLTEFCKSMNYKFVTKRVLKHLIYSGALDCFETDRSRLIQSIDLLRDCVKKKTNFILKEKRKISNRAKWKLWREEYLTLGCYVSELPITSKTEGGNKTVAVIVNQWPRYIRLVTNENRFDVISNLTHRVKIGLPYACEIKQSVCVKASFINI